VAGWLHTNRVSVSLTDLSGVSKPSKRSPYLGSGCLPLSSFLVKPVALSQSTRVSSDTGSTASCEFEQETSQAAKGSTEEKREDSVSSSSSSS